MPAFPIFTIHTVGIRETYAAYLERSEKATNFNPVFKRIAADMRRVEQAVFDSYGRRGGGSWKDLTIPWRLWKAKHNKDWRKLRMDLRLMKSVTKATSGDRIVEMDKITLRFGTRVEYAQAHQKGIPGRLPARPFLRFTTYDHDRWSNMIIDHIINVHGAPRM